MSKSESSLTEIVNEPNAAPSLPTYFYHTRETSILPQNELTGTVQRQRETAEQKRRAEEEQERRLQLEKQRMFADGQEKRRREREEQIRREQLARVIEEEEQALRELKGPLAGLLADLRGDTAQAILSLTGADFSSAQLRLIFRALAANRSVRMLSATRVSLGVHEVQALAGALAANCSVQSVQLDAGSIDSHGLAMLAESLTANTSLVHLSLNDNPLCSPDNAGLLALASALTHNDSLHCVQLLGCGLGTEEVCALADSLEENRALSQLAVDLDPALSVAVAARLHSLLRRNREGYEMQQLREGEERTALSLHYTRTSEDAAERQARTEEQRKTREAREALNAQWGSLFAARQDEKAEKDRRLEVALEREAEGRAAAKARKAAKKKG